MCPTEVNRPDYNTALKLVSDFSGQPIDNAALMREPNRDAVNKGLYNEQEMLMNKSGYVFKQGDMDQGNLDRKRNPMSVLESSVFSKRMYTGHGM